MNDIKFRDTVFIGLAALGLWLILRNRAAIIGAQENAAQSALPNAPADSLSPINLVYGNNPTSFGPNNLSVNVTPQLPAGLSDAYIPMFGFVGMAQGQTLQ